MFTGNLVSIITAATGHRNLPKCIASVQRQTFANVEHWLIVDGREREQAVRDRLAGLGPLLRPLHVRSLPHATGRDNWNGHRIYAAMSFLVNSEFVCFLDEDNWLDPDHIESLVSCIRSSGSAWGFSLRKIVDLEGNFIAEDNCESLGNLHSVFCAEEAHHIDLNCYLLRREVAVACAPAWYGPTRNPNGPEPDAAVCQFLLKHFPRVCSNRRHTVNYTVGNRPDSVQADFFLAGNRMMRERYPGGLPWEPKSSPTPRH